MRQYGWKRQLPDHRDIHWIQLPGLNFVEKSFSEAVDLRPHCPTVYDQGALGSCTANALAFVCEYDLMKNKNHPDWVPSRLFIYYNERELEGSVPYDAGANLRDGIKTLNIQGFAPEKLWPYEISQFAVKPSKSVYLRALKEKIKDYGAVNQEITEMKTVLSLGYPIIIGFTVYTSFESEEASRTGIIPMPEQGERVLGGHAVAIVGYESRGWIVRNSWGKDWGMDGYFIMPYEYFTNRNLSGDLWIIRTVPGVKEKKFNTNEEILEIMKNADM